MTIYENDLRYAIAGAAAVAKPMVGNNIPVTKDIKKTVREFEKTGVNKMAPFLGEEGINGARDYINKRKISVKEFFRENYTPKIMVKRAAQRAVLGAIAAGGISYYKNGNPENAAKMAAVGAGVGGVVGATLYPAIFYHAGKLSQYMHQKLKK